MQLDLHNAYWSIIPLSTSAPSSAGVFFLPPLPALLLPLLAEKRRPRETAVAALVENVRTRWRKQTGRQLSVFLCEVIMCSPRCFCSHANEVDRIGNHFQTLSQGKSRNGKTKARTKGCFAVVCVCMCAYVMCVCRSGGRNRSGCVFEVGLCLYLFFMFFITNPTVHCKPQWLAPGGGQRSPDSAEKNPY